MMSWTHDEYQKYLSKREDLPEAMRSNPRPKSSNSSKIPVIPSVNSGKSGNSDRIPAFALGRMKAGRMNKTERHYADLLNYKKQTGEVVEWWFEAINLRIGDNCFYRPDFLVMMKGGLLELHETKGWFTEDAKVKVRAIADKYPFPLKVVKLVKGRWEIKEY